MIETGNMIEKASDTSETILKNRILLHINNYGTSETQHRKNMERGAFIKKWSKGPRLSSKIIYHADFLRKNKNRAKAAKILTTSNIQAPENFAAFWKFSTNWESTFRFSTTWATNFHSEILSTTQEKLTQTHSQSLLLQWHIVRQTINHETIRKVNKCTKLNIWCELTRRTWQYFNQILVIDWCTWNQRKH